RRPPPPPAGPPAPAQERPHPRRDFDSDCLRSGCHAALNKTTFVHAPVAVGACSSCHLPEGEASTHRFRYIRPEKELCSFCHPPKTVMKFVHTAYGEGQCARPHAPHGARDALYLKNADRSALCLGCHDAPLPAAHEPGAEKVPHAFLH